MLHFVAEVGISMNILQKYVFTHTSLILNVIIFL